MTHQAPPAANPAGADPGRQVVQLREALRLVERIAGRAPAQGEALLDEAAKLSAAYESALPIARRRFDARAEEAAIWVAAGVEALLAATEGEPPRAAAGRLADTIEAELTALAGILA